MPVGVLMRPAGIFASSDHRVLRRSPAPLQLPDQAITTFSEIMTTRISHPAWRHLQTAAASLLPLAGLSAVSAAPVTWSTPQPITTSTEVATDGAPILAVHAKYYGVAETVNGVTFTPSPSLDLPAHIQDTQNGVTFDVNANGLNNTAPFIGSKQLAGTDADAYERTLSNAWEVNGGGNVTLTGLTNGRQYLVQFWVADFRHYPNDRGLTIGTSPELEFLGGNGSSTSSGRGNFITGTFTADGDPQVFPIAVTGADNVAMFNAFQLRDLDFVPPPPPPPFAISVDPASSVATLSWDSTPGMVYDVEASGDLVSWWDPPLGSEISPTGTRTSWNDPTSPDADRRFYRVHGRSTSRAGLTALAGDGSLHLDVEAWLARNNLVYNSPPTVKSDSFPLGSGKVGTALWIDPANGLTAHLNRTEGVPAMAGLGILRIPQLAGISSAPDYQGVLSIGKGILTQKAGGLTVTSFFRWGGEELVIDVQGADPNQSVTAQLSVYSGGSGHGSSASIAATYAIASDVPANEATGANCIAIAGGNGTTSKYPGFRATQFFTVKAVGRDVVASANAGGATVSFKPNPDGSYRVVVPVKLWMGSPIDATTLKPEALAAVGAVPELAADPLAAITATQSAAFGALWDTTSIIRLSSDHSTGYTQARFIEQMLALDTYHRLSASLTPLPAVGGGETRLFCWNAVGLFNLNQWYQNLRPVNYANIASGVWRANLATWDWHLDFLPQFQQHVTSKFPGYEGAGYPEYLDGQPGTGGSLLLSQNWGTWNIAVPGTKWYTSRQMSTTVEVVGAILSEYDYRQDPAFLDTYWPVIREGMLFHRSLLMDGGLGGDGRYHYLGVNSRENNWDDDDDTPDVANMRYLLPVVLDFAQQRGDTALVTKLSDLVGKLPEVATTTRTHPTKGPVRRSPSARQAVAVATIARTRTLMRFGRPT